MQPCWQTWYICCLPTDMKSNEARRNRLMLRLMGGIASAAVLAVFLIAQGTRPTPPARDPNTPGFVTAKELPDGTLPPIDADGNFVIGARHAPAPEMLV